MELIAFTPENATVSTNAIEQLRLLIAVSAEEESRLRASFIVTVILTAFFGENYVYLNAQHLTFARFPTRILHHSRCRRCLCALVCASSKCCVVKLILNAAERE